ncbi:MAG: beta strand repeat-containing protein, partial [Pirellulales bacterium]
DDAATLTISAPAIAETNTDQTVSFPVTLDRAVAGGFTVAFASTNSTADGSDYAVVTAGPLVFTGTAGETKNIEVTIKGDRVVEGSETFTLTLGAVTPAPPVQAASIGTGASATGTIANDDTATLTISAPAITETDADQTVNVPVTLDRAVAGGFTVAFASAHGTADGSDYAVVTASPLVFTGAAGETKNIEVTIQGDLLVEGNETFTLTLGAVTPVAPVLAGSIVTGASATGTITNDDMATLTISAPAITETNTDQTVNFAVRVDRAVVGGFTAAFSVADGSADGSDYTLVTASPLVFAGTAGETKNIEVTIQGDPLVEGDETFTLTLGAVTPAPPVQAGSIVTGASSTGTITNDDTATLSITAPAITETNTDQTVTFAVGLDRAVAGGFTVAFASTNGTADGSDYTVVTASPLVFTGIAGEMKNIEVTIQGDQVVEGDETFSLTLGAVTPAAPVQAGSIGTGASATGTITNDDTATLSITAPAITETNADQTVNFPVILDRAVAGGFTVAFSVAGGSADGSDYAVVTASPLVFTGAAGETKNIAVMIQGDHLVEGDETVTLTLGAVTPAPPVQAASIGTGASATGTINNDDLAGIDVTPTSGLMTTEADGTAAFTVTLTSQPRNTVTIPLTSSDTGEGTVPANVQLDQTNWNTGVMVTVTGADDDVVDGDVAYTIETGDPTSSDTDYDVFGAVDVADLSVTNEDLDTAEVMVSAISGNTKEDGTTATFTVTLTSQPTDSVTIPLTSSDTGEGTVPASVEVAPGQWKTGVVVTVTGQDDDVIDGDVAFTVATGDPASTDANFNALGADDVDDVSVINEDLDTAEVIVTAISGNTKEDGTTATFTVTLTSRPADTMTIPLTSSDTDEGTVPASVEVAPAQWKTGVTVTVTGMDDDSIDGDIAYTIVTGDPTSTDANFDALDAGDVNDVAVTNEDQDTAEVIVTAISGNTKEDGTTATFTVTLTSQPTDTVTIPLISSDTGEATVPASVEVAPGQWKTGVVVTVTGQDDDVIDGDIAYTVATGDPASTDANYDDLRADDVDDVEATNEDQDTAEIVVTPTTGLRTDEGGTSDTFIIRLTSRPSAAVTIPIRSSNTAEGTVDIVSAVLDATNWDTGVTVTLTGADDVVIDGDQTYTIITGDPSSADPNYDPLGADDVPDVSATNLDDDIARVLVNPISNVTTDEGGATATFRVRLSLRPSSAVTVSLTSSNTAEGTVDRDRVVLDTTNFDAGVTVTVTGVDDDFVDGDIAYTIVTGDPTSIDANYDALSASDVDDVSVTNEDLDTAEVIVATISGNTKEDGSTAMFTVTLTSRPADTVTIPLTSSDTGEGTVPASVEVAP